MKVAYGCKKEKKWQRECVRDTETMSVCEKERSKENTEHNIDQNQIWEASYSNVLKLWQRYHIKICKFY